ncbi:hypothetical protein V6N13_023135 [Hibiscus sabdariffa]
MMLQLADRSYVQPKGKIEDILVRVDKFIFPADFLIIDCEADEHAPIILGRPCLATSRVLIDFEKGELVLRVHEQQTTCPSQHQLAREFYANNATGENTVVNFRDKVVPVDAVAINEILDLPTNEPSIYDLIEAL